jgi:hypothetical protein
MLSQNMFEQPLAPQKSNSEYGAFRDKLLPSVPVNTKRRIAQVDTKYQADIG